jgi:hypothetical protein
MSTESRCAILAGESSTGGRALQSRAAPSLWTSVDAPAKEHCQGGHGNGEPTYPEMTQRDRSDLGPT